MHYMHACTLYSVSPAGQTQQHTTTELGASHCSAYETCRRVLLFGSNAFAMHAVNSVLYLHGCVCIRVYIRICILSRTSVLYLEVQYINCDTIYALCRYIPPYVCVRVHVFKFTDKSCECA